MATFVLIHGAFESAWHWHLLEPELRGRGHEVVAMDLPCEDDSAGLAEYADTVVDAIRPRRDLVLVAQSFGGFTAPLVCDRVPVELMVLVAGMVPSPGEMANDYWTNTRFGSAFVPLDGTAEDGGEDARTTATFLHDVPPDLAHETLRMTRRQSETPGKEPWPLQSWPDVPTKFLLCRDDRFFPAEWLHGVVQKRLGITPDEIDGSHCVALSRPRALADRLDGYVTERSPPMPRTKPTIHEPA